MSAFLMAIGAAERSLAKIQTKFEFQFSQTQKYHWDQ